MERNIFLQPVARFRSLRDTRPQPVTWQVIFNEIAATGYRAHLATLPAIETTSDA